MDLVVTLSKKLGGIALGGQFAAEGLDLFVQAVGFRLERLSFCFQAADFTGSEGFQRLSDCRQLGTEPMVLSPFLIVFRSEPVKFAAKLFELGLDRVALRLNGVAVFAERAQLRDDPIAVATERLVIGFQDANILGGRSAQGLSDRRQLGTEPLVLSPFLIVFRSEPVKFAAKLFELGLDRVALRLNGVAVFAERAQLRDDPIAVATERLVIGFQDANILGGRSAQRLSDRRQLGTEPMVLSPFLIVFRSEPVKFAAKLFELGLDRVALRLNGVAVFAERAQLRDDPIALPTERLVIGFQDANILGGRSAQGLSDRRQLGTEPMVLSPFLIVFRSEPVKFAAKLFELGLDRVALRLNGVAVFAERAQLRDDPIAVATERLVIVFQDANILGGRVPRASLIVASSAPCRRCSCRS